MSNSKIEIIALNHITLAVFNLEKSIEFYKIIFGVELLAKSENLAYFNLKAEKSPPSLLT